MIDSLSSPERGRGVTAADGSMKARIERAALDLFTIHGVDGVSIKQIAATAGISDGAMYRHYVSKEALASTLFDTIHAELYGLVAAALDDASDLDDAVRRVVRVYCEAADRDTALFNYHLTHMFRFGARESAGRPDPVTLIAERLKRAMARGEIPTGNAEVKAALALGVVLQPAAHRMVGRFDAPLADMADTLASAAIAALNAA